MVQQARKRIRTCIGCGIRSDKAALMRIVRTEDGVVYDATGRLPGRGAYVCSRECLQKAIGSHKLSRALKCSIERSDIGQVGADVEQASAATR